MSEATKYPSCNCGARWHQIGNRSGHCTGCHRTFSGLSAFDQHQIMVEGRSVCRDPADLGMVARPDSTGTLQWGSAGTWRGPDSDQDGGCGCGDGSEDSVNAERRTAGRAS